jgi:hypothetical protein
MDERNRSRIVTGAILILLGVGFLALQFLQGFGQAAVLFLIGGAFIAAYLLTRRYGLLIPGGILVGIGLGSIGEQSVFAFQGLSTIGLGIGFVAIYVIALVYQGRAHWWPLIPGLILIAIGLSEGSRVIQQLFSIGWPLILIFAGLVLLAGAFGLFRHRRE